MSKKEKTVKAKPETMQNTITGKSREELEGVVQTLQTQLQHHQTMAVKAQGAIEVVLQMIDNGEEKDGGESNDK